MDEFKKVLNDKIELMVEHIKTRKVYVEECMDAFEEVRKVFNPNGTKDNPFKTLTEFKTKTNELTALINPDGKIGDTFDNLEKKLNKFAEGKLKILINNARDKMTTYNEQSESVEEDTLEKLVLVVLSEITNNHQSNEGDMHVSLENCKLSLEQEQKEKTECENSLKECKNKDIYKQPLSGQKKRRRGN